MEKLSRAKFIDKIKGIKFYVGSIWKKENDTMGLLEKTKMDLEILVNNGIDQGKLAMNTRTINKIQSNAIAFNRPSSGMEVGEKTTRLHFNSGDTFRAEKIGDYNFLVAIGCGGNSSVAYII